VSSKDPHAAAEFIIKSAKPYAQAKANRMYIEEHRKTLKALLMNESTGKTVSDREQYAYSHKTYQELLQEFKNAILEEETLRIQIKGAELVIEIWRSENASNRNQDRALR
jgi:hypothetical protein